MPSENLKTLSLSLSLACIANSAVASIDNGLFSADNKNIDNNDNNIASNIYIKPDVSGVKTARLSVLGGMVGSSAEGGTTGSVVESCYSNCHIGDLAQACVSSGYTYSTACPANYTKVECPSYSRITSYNVCYTKLLR